MFYTILIALGGAAGSVARYWIGLWAVPISRSLPIGTIGINVAGSFLIGLVGTLTLHSGRYPAPDWLRLFVMVGFCGGFTTFSSFSLQTFDLVRAGSVNRALANVALSVVLCLAAVAAGHAVGAYFNGGAIQTAAEQAEDDAA